MSEIMSMSTWNPNAVRYMKPKTNAVGGKSITVISSQTNRSVYVTLPKLITWGISDYTDAQTGESNGKFNISLQFPRDCDRTPETDTAINKLKAFEEQILEDAVPNSEIWFGKKQSREIVEYGYFPFLKYSKDKDTGKVDPSKGPAFRPKVPKYQDKWNVEVWDADRNMIFPSADDEDCTPMDFVPSRSSVISIVQCGGLWVGGKGWGITWKLTQCVVKPQVMQPVLRGQLHVEMSAEDTAAIKKDIPINAAEPEPELDTTTTPTAEEATFVEDSDDDEPVQTPVAPEPEPVPEPTPTKAPVKKVIAKPKPKPVEAEAEAENRPAEPEPEPEPEPAEAPKTVIKKKVVAKKKPVA